MNMEDKDYLKSFHRLKQSINLKEIEKTYLQNGKLLQDTKGIILKENEAFTILTESLLIKGCLYKEIESILLEYSSAIQEIYIEMGIKAGARLEAEYLRNNK